MKKMNFMGFISANEKEDVEVLFNKEIKKMVFKADSIDEAKTFFKKKLKKNNAKHWSRLFYFLNYNDRSTFTEIKIKSKPKGEK